MKRQECYKNKFLSRYLSFRQVYSWYSISFSTPRVLVELFLWIINYEYKGLDLGGPRICQHKFCCLEWGTGFRNCNLLQLITIKSWATCEPWFICTVPFSPQKLYASIPILNQQTWFARVGVSMSCTAMDLIIHIQNSELLQPSLGIPLIFAGTQCNMQNGRENIQKHLVGEVKEEVAQYFFRSSSCIFLPERLTKYCLTCKKYPTILINLLTLQKVNLTKPSEENL